MAVLLPILAAMILGRTIDLRDYRIAGVAYSDGKYTEKNVNELSATMCVDLTTCLGPVIPLDMMLRVKSGFMSTASGAMGLDGLLKNSRKTRNSVTAGVVAIHKTVTRSLPEGAEPLPQWQERVPSSSTHYTKAVHYANWFVAINNLECDIAEDVPKVRDIVTGAIHGVLPVNNTFPDLWWRVRKELKEASLRGAVREVISVYSSSPISTSLQDPEDVLVAINELTGLLKDEGNIGEPLQMELAPLKDLDPKFPEVTSNVTKDVETDLLRLNQMLDDVLDTRPKMTAWIRDMLEPLDEEQSSKIVVVLSDMAEVERVLYDTVVKFSYYGSMDQRQLKKAMHVYEMALPDGKDTYREAFLEMKEMIGALCLDEYVKKGKGLLHVVDSEHEGGKTGQVMEDGLEGCQQWCSRVEKCRSFGYGEDLSVQDPTTGSFSQFPNRCWLFYRSTATASMMTPTDVRGDVNVYDRQCN